MDCKDLFSNRVVCSCSKTDRARFFFLESLGVNVYPWEIVGMDFVNVLTKCSEFHLATIIDYFLPFEMAHFFSCHKKSPLTKH